MADRQTSKKNPDSSCSEEEYQRWLDGMRRDAEAAYSRMLVMEGPRVAEMYRHAAEEVIEHSNPAYFEALDQLNKTPATIDEFLDSREFLGMDTNDPLMEIWPKLRPVIKSMNPDVFVGEEPVHIALMGGATGWGKSFSATVTMAYQVYLLTCFKNPHRLFRLSQNTPIVFMFMSASRTLARRTLYEPFRQTFTAMPYTKTNLDYNRYKSSELELGNNILVTPALASLSSILGQAIPGGVVDEINFMSYVENSTQVAGPTGQGGTFDQADEVWSNLVRRRRRSFATAGVSIGTLCAPSSVRYKGDYLDRQMEMHDRLQTPNVLVQRYKQYDIAPLKDKRDTEGQTFRVLVGTDNYPTRVLEDDEVEGRDYPQGGRIETPPISYRQYFEIDPEGAARDILGVASNSITPFFAQRHKVIESMLRFSEQGLEQFIIKPDVILSKDGMPQIDETKLPHDRETPRFIHVDLSSTVDRCGIAMVRYDGHVPVPSKNNTEEFDLLPRYVVEMAVSIKPDSLNQIDPAEIRRWVSQLSTFYHMNIVSVSYDSYQSKESLTQYRKVGIASREVSVDRTSDPYRTFRSAVYEDRVVMPDTDILRKELISLEYITDKDKIDHPPAGSKDVSDAVCGALFNASRNRFIRENNAVVNSSGRPKRNTTTSSGRQSGMQRRQDVQRR